MSRTIKLVTLSYVVFFLIFATGAGAAAMTLSAGWNLASSRVDITVASTFSDDTKFTSVWKWESSKWAVYLPGEADGGKAYAAAKGFSLLSTITPGEGFWVNSKTSQNVTVDGSEVTNNTMSLDIGWNLKGLTKESSIATAFIFSDSTQFASVWKWIGSKWAVYLPGEETPGSYAAEKGFDELTSISPGEGFWVNVSASGTLDVNIDQPPPVAGKVVEMVAEDAFVPVSGVEIWNGDAKLQDTDSQGLFSIVAQENDTVSFKKTGYVSYDLTVENQSNNLIFIKKIDSSPTVLAAVNELIAKPAPKVLSSHDKDAWIVITGMNLTKDITVALSCFKGAYEIEDTDNLNVPTGWENYMIIGGADVFRSDALGDPITNTDAGFKGKVRPAVAKIFGKLDFKGLKQLLDDSKAKVYLFYYHNEQWHMVGEAKLRTKGKFQFVTAKENVMKGLYPFIFVLNQVGAESQFNTGTLTGQVLDKETKASLKNATVFIAGNQAYAVTDAGGNFSLPYKLTASMDSTTISVFKEQYFTAVLKRKVVDLEKAVSIEMTPFTVAPSISGTIITQDQGPKWGADVFLRLPIALDKVENKENGISVGFDLAAVYKWEVLDEEESVLFSIEEKGKYFLAKIDSDQIQKAVPANGTYNLKLTVTRQQEGAVDFVEATLGSVTVSDTELTYSLFPQFTFPSILKAKSSVNGDYEFKSIPAEMLPFIKIQAEAAGYKPSALAPLPTAEQGFVTKNITLTAKEGITEFSEGFEGTVSGWVVAGGSSVVKLQQVTDPESIQVADDFLGSGSYPDEVFKDVDGTLSNITVLESIDSASGTFTIAKGDVTFIDADSSQNVISATLFDEDGGGYDFIESNAEEDGYYVWTENISPDLLAQDTVTVSYPDPDNNAIALLPAMEGNSYYWFGNLNNGTYSDPGGSNTVMDASLVSPVVDLTQYSNVTLKFAGWFEILYDGMPNPQLKVEIALYDDGKNIDDEIVVQSISGDFKFRQGHFTEIFEANPMIKNYYEILIPPPSIPETYTNYSSAGFDAIPKWKEYDFNLDPFAGHKVKVRFRIQFVNSPQNIYRGWGIDHVRFLDKNTPIDFAVMEPNSDFEPPTLTSITVSDESVEINKPVEIVVQGDDNIWGVGTVIAHLKTIFGDDAGSQALTYDSESGFFKGSKVFEEGEHGTYEIWKVTMEDYVGNSQDYLADIDYNAVNFTVEDPDTPPVPMF